jgi:3-methyladenine DNA glycosylase AlkD
MITYKNITNIADGFLEGYKRYSTTTKVLYLDKGILKEKNTSFNEDWNSEKLVVVSGQLKALLSRGGIVIAAFDNKKVIAFMSIDCHNFQNYTNVPFVHVSHDYRGRRIGAKLFYIGSIFALRMGAKKLYISGHPSIETQAFYKHIGCTQATYYNEKLVELEPYDIQLEYSLDYVALMFKLVEIEFDKYPYVTSVVITKAANTSFKYLPVDDDLFVQIVRLFIQNKTYGFFSVGTLWVKKRKSVIDKKYMSFFEQIVLNDLTNWAEVDQFCYRIMNPLIELDTQYFSYLDKWSLCNSKDVRRVSLVSMIRTCKSGLKLYYNFEQMIFLVDRLKNDKDIHVRKAVGWVLKCAYPTYPKKVEAYLRANVSNLDRLIFRYALEHVSKEKKTKLMSLER